ncbi:MAG: magnesium/cobalt transporter CorA [Edaphocola sp.]
MLRKAYRNTIGHLLPSFTARKKQTTYNPKREVLATTDTPTHFSIYRYNEQKLEEYDSSDIKDCCAMDGSNEILWANVDGLRKHEVEQLCAHFGIHPLLVEDILSIGQRAKADDMDNHLFALLPMLTYNADTGIVQVEQLSLILGRALVLSFQPDPRRDPFNPIREKLKNAAAPVRKKEADYLAYLLIDAVVDDYFAVLEQLSDRLEKLEDEVLTTNPNGKVLLKVTLLRQEIVVVKRAITPVRELVTSFWHTENRLVNNQNRKYFKDVYDHITLAIEYAENYREMALNIQDLYMNQVNMRMNQVMKILTVVTTLLAPATVIGGIFGMNFKEIPFQDYPHGFAMAVVFMFGISLLMLLFFIRKKWF